MSALQWALLILSVAIVVAVVVISRRERKQPPWQAPPAPSHTEEPEAGGQLDIFQRPVESVSEPPPPSAATAAPIVASPLSSKLSFDEYGVGRPRKRVAPSLAPADGEASAVSEPLPEPSAPAFLRAPSAGPVAAAPVSGPAPVAAKATPTVSAAPKVQEKIVALLIAAREGAPIPGPKLHQALAAQGLAYGAKQIYHRYSGRLSKGEPVFSVASLVKPGVLLPEEAAGFSTPGLSVFMVLPGPVKPLTALHDMLSTAQSLARALDAEVFDGKKQPLTSESMRGLQAEVEEWARAARL